MALISSGITKNKIRPITPKIITMDKTSDITLIIFLCFLLSMLNTFLSICFIGTFIIKAIAIPTISGKNNLITKETKSMNIL